MYINDVKTPSRHGVQYFAATENRAIYQDGWVAAARHGVPWEKGYRQNTEYYQDQSARIQIGDMTTKADVPANATSVVLSMALPKGQTEMQTWLQAVDRIERGAFYVYVKQLKDRI